VAFKADVKGAHTSPLGNEIFAAMDPGGRDTFVWMQNAEPGSLYCGDETDGESLRACNMVTEGLYAYEQGGTKSIPALATACDPNADLTVWTCKLREGVKFHDGSDFDANDVVMTYQGNRNPFVDHPEFITAIWDSNAVVTGVEPPATPAAPACW